MGREESQRRHEGQPPDAVAHSWRAQHRLHRVFQRLAGRKTSQIAAVAVVRGLAGFVWALMQKSAVEIEGRRRDEGRLAGLFVRGATQSESRVQDL